MQITEKKLLNLLFILLACIFTSSQFINIENNLGPNSEFFVFSWIYGVRWGQGEYIFSPHSHLIYPVFSAIDKIFGMSNGDMKAIMLSWKNISYYWPIILAYINMIILYASSSDKNKSMDILLFSCIYMIMFSFGVGPAELSSMSYHSISITMGFLSLFFYKAYLDEENVIYFKHYYKLLGLYTALCVLSKITFIVFVLPIYFIEILLAIKYKDKKKIKNIVGSVLASILIYLLYLYFFYGSMTYVNDHFKLTEYFITSQKDYYSENKGRAFLNYILQQIGWSWIVLISICLLITFNKKISLFAILFGLLIGILFFYGRPNSHAVPEFFALIFCLLMFSIRSFYYKYSINKRVELLCIFCWSGLFFYFYPLPFKGVTYITEMNKVDKQIIPEIMSNDEPIVIAVIQPEFFMGSVDAWCRGSKDLFVNRHSDYFDKKFNNNTCLVNEENPNFNVNLYKKIYTIRSADEDLESFLKRFKNTFPSYLNLHLNCIDMSKLDFNFVNSFIVRCDMAK